MITIARNMFHISIFLPPSGTASEWPATAPSATPAGLPAAALPAGTPTGSAGIPTTATASAGCPPGVRGLAGGVKSSSGKQLLNS